MIYDENLLNEEQQKIEACYAQLGERYYAAHKNDDSPEFPDLTDKIKESEKRIADHKAEVLKANGLMLCPSCGEQIYYKSMFCNFCGVRVAEKPAEEPVAEAPEIEAPEIEEPEIEEPEIEVPAIEEPAIEEPEIENPAAEAESEGEAHAAPPIETPQHFDFAPSPSGFKAMRICKNCGAQMDESCTFCMECGTPFPSDEEEMAAQEKPEEPAGEEAEKSDSEADTKSDENAAPKPAGPRFCVECGFKILDPEAMFCRSCGAKLDGSSGQTPAPPVNQDEVVVKRCPRCGFNTTDKDVFFCIECGMRLI